MTTTNNADFDSNQFRAVMSQPLPEPEETATSDPLLTADAQTIDQATTEKLSPTEAIEPIPTHRFDTEKLIQEIASLEARIAADQQALAKMPRTKRINSVSTRSASEAAYLNMWRAKCERIGAINYPAGRLEGEVLILVSILSDGTLEEVRILKSSGHRKLDRAALATVRQECTTRCNKTHLDTYRRTHTFTNTDRHNTHTNANKQTHTDAHTHKHKHKHRHRHNTHKCTQACIPT